MRDKVAAENVPAASKNCDEQFWPEPGPDNKILAKKAFLKLWVAGTVGGFFAALVRNVAIDVQKASLHPDWCYTADLLLSYGYFGWLIAYFFLSNLRLEYETPTTWAVIFDVTQSLCAFIAALCLGFVLPSRDFSSFPRSSGSFVAANAAIAILAVLSLSFGGGLAIMRLRWIALCASIIAIVAGLCQPFGTLHTLNRAIVSVMLAVLCVVLASFGYIRVCQLHLLASGIAQKDNSVVR
jgi:hypothetical protein